MTMKYKYYLLIYIKASEDKVNHLNKVKAKMEATLDELEDTLEREKKLRGDVEKAKRKMEVKLKKKKYCTRLLHPTVHNL